MLATARNSLLLCLFLLPACAVADQTGLYRNAGIKQMPLDLEELTLVKTDARLAEIATPVPGQHSVVRYESTHPGMPLISDSGSRKTIVVVIDQPSLTPGKYEVGKEILAAYLTEGPPSMPIGTYCLGMAKAGSIDITSKQPGLYDVVFDLEFSEISAADFKDVCKDDHFKKAVRNLRQTDLKG